MPTIAIQTQDASHLTFLLLAGKETLSDGATERDCIIMGPPKDVALMEHPVTMARTEHLHVEHKARIEHSKGTTELTVVVANSASLKIHIGRDGTGSWQLDGEYGCAVGICKLAKAST